MTVFVMQYVGAIDQNKNKHKRKQKQKLLQEGYTHNVWLCISAKFSYLYNSQQIHS